MILKIILIISGIIVFAVLLLLLWFIVSPMPVVRLMRRGDGAPPSYPEGFDEKKGRVEVLRDLTYPSAYGKNKYDLYYPKSADHALPLILWIHGGAFVAGDKSGVENWAVCLADEGYAVAAMDYEWAPEAHWPAQLIQAGECLQEVLSQAYDGAVIDSSRIILSGDSAGAHIAAQFVLQNTSRRFNVETGLPPALPPDSIKAVLLYCGPYDIREMSAPKDKKLRLFMSRVGWSYLGKKNWQSSPLAEKTIITNYINESFPPCYITDGNAFSFEKQGRRLAGELSGFGVTVSTRFFNKDEKTVYHEYQFSLDQPDAILCYKDTIEFLKQFA